MISKCPDSLLARPIRSYEKSQYAVVRWTADLKRFNSVELFQRFRLLVGVTHGKDVGGHFRYDIPRKADVIIYCVLSTDSKSDDVIVVDEGRNHVYFARHVDSPQ